MTRALSFLGLLTLLLGCEPSVPEGIFACESDTDCPPEQRCELRLERCYTPDGG